MPLEQDKVGDLLDLMLVPVFGRIALGDAVLPVNGGDSSDVSPGPDWLGVGILIWFRLAGLDDAEKSLN